MPVHETSAAAPWRDAERPAAERVDALVAELTLEEKIAQLYGIWIAASNDGAEVAPNQNEMTEDVDLDTIAPLGLGQLTRTYGTVPVDPAAGAVSLLRTQQRIVAESRLGIPALAHEECLAGFAAWGATAYPVPLSWGASWSPEIVQEMGERIGADMRKMGVHQGLAPVLDVVRDARWGRVEETIGEDPLLVGTIATAYVKGIESAGVVATLKHFAGYSASKAGRNLAPVSIGRRELNDVILPPFEMAIRESGVRSVMNSYTDLDGVPSAADESLLTGLLRDTWGFDGTVVADYFAIAFLLTQHGVAEDWTDAAHQALKAGIDVELPGRKTFGPDLVAAVREGVVPEALIDRALRRVLAQKIELGLLDGDAGYVPAVLAGRMDAGADEVRGTVDLDPASNRALARRLAEQAIVLLHNDGTLPLRSPRRIAVIGPNGDDPYAVLGCYSFPLHVGIHHPEFGAGIALPTLLDSLRREFPDAEITYAQGTSVDGGERDFDEALAAAREADVVILALGDRAGLFGRGTSGEGCDVADLTLPGAQQELMDAVVAAGTPTVVTLLAGRPYALGSAVTDAAAIVEAFFAGEEGTPALAGVLSGRINPSGRLPVSVPASAGAQPSTYLAVPLARKSGVSNIDPSAAFPFGHGLTYTTFSHTDLEADVSEIATDGTVTVSLRVTNTGDRDGVDVVQLYVHDPVAQTPRPVQRLIGYVRVPLAAGDTVEVRFGVSADLFAYTGRAMERIVDAGEIVLSAGRSSGDLASTVTLRVVGDTRVVDHTRALAPTVAVTSV
ncbi:glycoside hydrolase family 3 N-terminal domain-containing protein [Microbacterium invictum]|uniref:beta-xylosidase/alpha-l-arabinosidase n=1 Tax=Microbacterium invictum TaxID=515415 RepID=UPI00161EEFE4|nr:MULTISPECIES: glycoside hydrolase family 3 N-terminal domain-containing protein [Microbacterium]